jgi:hypothetical protein
LEILSFVDTRSNKSMSTGWIDEGTSPSARYEARVLKEEEEDGEGSRYV